MNGYLLRSLAFVLCVSAVLAVTDRVSAANITHEPLGNEAKLKGVELIVVEGELKPGDEERFRLLSVLYDKAIVALDSPGGSLLPGIEIGKMIHLKEYSTLVARNDVCTSSCALIWVAGSTRYISANGRVGFHASYQDSAGHKQETGVGNALVGHYLGLLNLTEKAIVFATSAPPDRIAWLTVENMRSSGIAFETLDDTPSPPPIVTMDAPSPTRAAQGSAAARGWEKVAVSKGVTYFIDRQRVGTVGRYVSAWVKADHSRDPTVRYYASNDLWYFDCASRRLALKAYASYDQAGKSLDTHELSDSEMEWQSALPDSVGEADLQFVCD